MSCWLLIYGKDCRKLSPTQVQERIGSVFNVVAVVAQEPADEYNKGTHLEYSFQLTFASSEGCELARSYFSDRSTTVFSKQLNVSQHDRFTFSLIPDITPSGASAPIQLVTDASPATQQQEPIQVKAQQNSKAVNNSNKQKPEAKKAAQLLKCSTCHKKVPSNLYSNNQRSKGDNRLCPDCVAKKQAPDEQRKLQEKGGNKKKNNNQYSDDEDDFYDDDDDDDYGYFGGGGFGGGHDFYDDDDDDEYFPTPGGMMSQGEMDELLCQDIKPWDDDAPAALEMLCPGRMARIMKGMERFADKAIAKEKKNRR